jgi:4-amino-4-deoxy-L-arabinose transferase-like glycosyltransferase
LRIYHLAILPSGFHADEVRVGWNAYSLLRTLHDDRGNSLPLYYNTFGDYRPTDIFYLTIPSIIVFGLNEFAVRFPAAFIGTLTIIPLALFAEKITSNKKVAAFSSLLLAISPWHISVSRAASEQVVCLYFALSALYFLVSFIKQKQKKYLAYSFILFFVSFLFYHSVRLLAPLFIVAILYYYWPKLNHFKHIKQVGIFVLSMGVVTALFVFSKSGQARYQQVSVFNHGDFKQEYLSYFSGSFLVGDDAKPFRYRTPGIGVLTYAEFLFFIIGIATCIKNKNTRLPLLLLLLAPLPAAITYEDSPNLQRSLFMLPFISIIVSWGIYYLYQHRPVIYRVGLLVLVISFVHFFRIYTTKANDFF